jgi:DNA-damage-inducible protein J
VIFVPRVSNHKTANVNIRLYPEIKEEAERIFGYHGLSIAEAVTVFLNHACRAGGFPFDLKPAPYTDEISMQALKEAVEIENNPHSKGFKTMAALMEDLENDDE